MIGIKYTRAPAAGLSAAMARTLAGAVARGLNRTASQVVTSIARPIAAEAGLNVSAVKKYLSTGKATKSRFTATVAAKNALIPLIHFKAKGPEPSRGRGQGVTARVNGETISYRHAFIATVRGPLPSGVVSPGHRGVFRRRGAKRLPIRQLYGPPLGKLFTKHVAIGRARRDAMLEQNMQHEIAFALSKMKK